MSTASISECISESGAQWHVQDNDICAPSDFGNPSAEYEAVSQQCALHYAGHWGRLLFSGSEHAAFLHRMTTNHFLELRNEQGFEAVFTENRGRIIDVGTFYHRADQTLGIVSPANRQAIPNWLDRYIFAEDITIDDIGDSTSSFELIGPETGAFAAALWGISLEDLPPHQLAHCDDPQLWIAKLDLPWTGLRLIGPSETLASLWRIITERGISPLGETAWNLRRMELGIPLFNSELNEEHNPWEAGLGRAIHMNKGCYIGQEVIARLDTYDKVKQHLVGLSIEPETLPAPGTTLYGEQGPVGAITSSAQSPAFGSIALAYIRRAYCTPGTLLHLGNNGLSCRVHALPFSALC